MTQKKYKLLRAGSMPIHRTSTPYKNLRFYRIQALRDIPEHGVKKGDLGGYVTHRNNLSQEGSCWVGGEAQICGRVSITQNAYIGDKAVVSKYWFVFSDSYNPGLLRISGNAKITGNALVESHRFNGAIGGYNKVIDSNVQIFGNAFVQNVHHITEDAKIYGKAFLNATLSVSGTAEIFGDAVIGTNCKISGDSKIFDSAKLEEGAEVKDSVIAGGTQLFQNQRVVAGKINETTIGSTMESLETLDSTDLKTSLNTLEAIPEPSTSMITLQLFNDIQDSIASYETDIVKLIKYPAMVDKSIPETLALMVALTKAKRLLSYPESDEFRKAVEFLEEKFFIAESKATKMASTLLSDEEKKKTEKAKDLLRIASDEASSEHEKKVSFKQAFKQLEGVIAVPEIAVDTFRVKIGLKEIESLDSQKGSRN